MVVFGGDDLSTFEVCATVLLNWGRQFYEYHPNPPVGLLGDAERLLARHAPALHAHLFAIGAAVPRRDERREKRPAFLRS